MTMEKYELKHDTQRIQRFLNDPQAVIVDYFLFPRVGWEMDNKFWFVKTNGETKAITTNHGGMCFVNEVEHMKEFAELESMVAKARAVHNKYFKKGE